MKKHYLKYLILLLLTVSCIGNNQIEAQLMNCLYSSYSDNGAEFKQAILDYEYYLISNGILIDGTGKSYRNIFEKIKEGNGMDFSGLNSFSKKMMNFEKVNQDRKKLATDCKKEILNNNNFSQGYELNSVLKSFKNAEETKKALLADKILSILQEKDFELDYYKLQTFFIIETLIPNSAENSRKEKTTDLSNVLKIYIDHNNKIYLNSKETSVQNLKKQIIDYVHINKSKSVIVLNADKKSLFQNYIRVQNEIVSSYNFLRNQLSQKKFNMTYYELTENKKKEIDEVYPENIVTK